eukprot:scaffold56546_cov42-Prasinocladus_malaysianus.AAC.2
MEASPCRSNRFETASWNSLVKLWHPLPREQTRDDSSAPLAAWAACRPQTRTVDGTLQRYRQKSFSSSLWARGWAVSSSALARTGSRPKGAGHCIDSLDSQSTKKTNIFYNVNLTWHAELLPHLNREAQARRAAQHCWTAVWRQHRVFTGRNLLWLLVDALLRHERFLWGREWGLEARLGRALGSVVPPEPRWARACIRKARQACLLKGRELKRAC